MNVAKLLLSLTVACPNFPIEDLKNGNFPKFRVIFTNFSALIEKKQGNNGLDDYGAEEDEAVDGDQAQEKKSVIEWYEDLKKEYIEGVTTCVEELLTASSSSIPNS